MEKVPSRYPSVERFAQPHTFLQTPSMQVPLTQPSAHSGRQVNCTISHASVGPHCAHSESNTAPGGQAISGQYCKSHTRSPSTQVHSLQLRGSSMPVAPFGYVSPFTRQYGPSCGSNESSQRPASEQWPVVGT